MFSLEINQQKHHQNAPEATKSDVNLKNFLGVTPPDPLELRGPTALALDLRPRFHEKVHNSEKVPTIKMNCYGHAYLALIPPVPRVQYFLRPPPRCDGEK